MRRLPSWMGLAPALLLGGCSYSLQQGDRGLAEGRYADASKAYAGTWSPQADAALFRTALLHSMPESTVYDPARAAEVLDQLQQRYPKSAYGLAAKLVLSRLQLQTELQSRLRTVDEELSRSREALSRAVGHHQIESRALQTYLGQLEAEREQIHAELKLLREEHVELLQLRQERADVEALREENARLKEELEELKRIDLRR